MPAKVPLPRKVDSLFARFEEGVRTLFTNRQRRLQRQRKLFEDFVQKPFVVDQSEMRFVP